MRVRPTHDNPVLKILGPPPLIGPVLKIMGPPPDGQILGTPLSHRCLHSYEHSHVPDGIFLYLL